MFDFNGKGKAIMKSKVLVTGAAGFVGKHLVKYLSDKGYSVRALVRKNSDISCLKGLNVDIVEAELKVEDSLLSAMDGVDHVVHLASAMKGPWEEYFATNVSGTRFLLEIAKDKGIEKFIYISSISVCDVSSGTGKQITEDTPYAKEPLSLYERSKIQAEQVVKEFCRQGLSCTIIRPGVIYGPSGNLCPSRLGLPLGEDRFLLIGNGYNRIPFVYIDNLIDAIHLALTNKDSNGEIYNIIDKQSITQNDYLNRVNKRVNPSLSIVRIPYFVMLAMSGLLGTALKMIGKSSPFRKIYLFQCSHQLDYVSKKAEDKLGWKPRVNSSDALDRTFNWFKNSSTPKRDIDLKDVKGKISLKKPVSVGIVGCGVIATTHLNILKNIKNANIASLCDFDISAAEKIGKQFGITKMYKDYDEMLRREKLDIIHILTPPQLHKEQAVKAARNNCHVFVEKPFTVNAQEAKEIIGAAEKNNIKVCVGHNHVYDPIMIEARRLIDKGLLGDIVSVESWYGFNLGENLNNRYMTPGAEKHWTVRLPGKLYQNLLSHPLSVLADIIGYPDQLTAYTAGGKVVKTMPHDELRVLAKCGEKIGFISVSLSVSPRYQLMNIYGTKMSLNLDFLNKTLIKHSVSKVLPAAFSRVLINMSTAKILMGSTFRNVWKTLTKTFTPYDGTEILIKEFYRSITEEKIVPVSAEDGFKSMEAMDKIWSQIKF
jgi:nucleoside-diphosphate-sugar epimerase/predicted dehydrogenase